MAHIVTKWPRLLIEGRRVTPEQAEEIILRTTPYLLSNDKEWMRMVGEVLSISHDSKWGDLDYKSVDAWHHRIHGLPLNYLTNSQIMSAWVGGPHGWVNWDGRVKATTWNIGKWPSVEEVERDLSQIATAFPFLEFRMQLLEDEGEGDLCGEWHVSDGRWEEAPSPGDRIEPDEIGEAAILDIVFNSDRERGVSLERLQSASRRLDEKFRKESNG